MGYNCYVKHHYHMKSFTLLNLSLYFQKVSAEV